MVCGCWAHGVMPLCHLCRHGCTSSPRAGRRLGGWPAEPLLWPFHAIRSCHASARAGLIRVVRFRRGGSQADLSSTPAGSSRSWCSKTGINPRRHSYERLSTTEVKEKNDRRRMFFPHPGAGDQMMWPLFAARVGTRVVLVVGQRVDALADAACAKSVHAVSRRYSRNPVAALHPRRMLTNRGHGTDQPRRPWAMSS